MLKALRQLFRHPALSATAFVLAGSLLWSSERIATGQPVFPYTQDPTGAVTFIFPVNFAGGGPAGYVPPQSPSGRLTLTSGTPVLVANVIAATSVLYTPYLGSMIDLYDGTGWLEYTFAEMTNVLANSTVGNAGPAALAANQVADLFVWNSGTRNAPVLTLTRGPAYATPSNVGGTAARAAGGGLTLQNGIQLNTTAISNGPPALRGTFVGTIAADTGGGTVTFQPGGVGVAQIVGFWNMYNRVTLAMNTQDNGASYNYTSATVREQRGATLMQATIVMGAVDDAWQINAFTKEQTLAVSGAALTKGFGVNVTNAATCQGHVGSTNSGAAATVTANSFGCTQPSKIGQSVIAMTESSDGSNANFFDFSSSDVFNFSYRY